MKKIALLLSLLISATVFSYAACGGGQSEIMITIIQDNYPLETHWSLRDGVTNALIDTGNVIGDTLCVASNNCLRFTIFDQAGDGLCCGYGNGSYSVKVNGVIVASGGHFGANETSYFNCPPGQNCGSALTAVKDTMTALNPETWYVFTADSSGTYEISTCALGNTCDTKIYVYDHCAAITISEGNTGTTFYDDDGCGVNLQSRIVGALAAGSMYYIRIGDYDTSCRNHTINWQIKFNGPIVGCTDMASCNYNPLATISDSSCVYPPSPLCAGPDLTVDGNELETSMYVDNLTVGQTNCYISEGCLSGYGVRRLIRFTTHIRNIGNLDYFIGAPDTSGGQFVFDACHGHWHYSGYAEYLVYDQFNQPLQQGFKNGFCVLDLECSGGGQAKFGCGNMGISVGCGDIYSSGLDCQWIDVTDIDTGNYTLVVRVNWDQSPDKLGHYEKTYTNNWSQVCFNLFYDGGGNKIFSILPNCIPYVDCAGDTFGNASRDCNLVCNGSGKRGDVDINSVVNTDDMNLYLNGIKEDTLTYSPCDDLNGDSMMTVTDAARLNGCLLFNTNQHHHPGGTQNTHKHCEFPFNIYNPFDSIMFSIADTDLEHHFIDLSVYNPNCLMLAYEFKLHGLMVDSIKNLALGNYGPDIRWSTTGHVVGISNDENSLFKQLAPLNFLRVYFSSLTDSQICISTIVAVLNADYEEVHGKITNGCIHVAQQHQDTVISHNDFISPESLRVIPNPSAGVFEIYLDGKSLSGAEIKVFDELGQIVLQNKNETLTNHTTLDLTTNESGMYLLQINLNGKIISKRLMLMKR